MDVRPYLFEPLNGQLFAANLTAAESGILAGTTFALDRASELGLSVLTHLPDGSDIQAGVCVLSLRGSAEQIARAEEELLGCVGKPSGVATASCRFAALAGGRARIVCGAWKKVAPEIRKQLRAAIEIGGACVRLVDEPFVYLDKNFVRMFAGITEVVGRAHSMKGRVVSVQIRGETGPIAEEAVLACRAGAGVLMVDTGSVEDLREVVEEARRQGFRQRVKIAFGGSVTAQRLEEVVAAGADIIDIGRAIIDAPILDFRLDVQQRVQRTPVEVKCRL
ncbi:MAG: nicotinate-nucleotide pyrophosphorylase [Syntrophobacteraceae bacterium]|jgi:nicotinate-nucleotide pyrophosphorylase (carboxylating)